MRRTTVSTLALAMSLLLLAAACGSGSGEDPLAVNGDQGFDVEDDLGDQIDDPIAPGTGLDGEDAPSSDEVVQAALIDVDAFWDREYEDLYGDPYQTIEGGYWPYGPDSEQPPCGDPAPDYGDIAENAFYCPGADLVAWDNVNLVPGMYEEFGGFTLGIVFAHEFGHAIQTRATVEGDTIMTELQADCFAGAWTSDVAEGNSEFFKLELDDLDKAIAGFLDLRDTVGTAAEDPQAHGTGFDRIGAFTDGFESGLEQCAAYPDLYDAGELVITESEFTDQEDFERGGNMDISTVEAQETILSDLQNFWEVVFGELGQTWEPVDGINAFDPASETVTCGEDTYEGDILENASFYCVPDDSVYIDANLVGALNEVGDYAVVTELARQFAYAAQVKLGNLDNSLAANLQADCYAGVYAFSGFSNNRADLGGTLILSPGDLDEAVIAFLLTSDSSADVENEESVSVGTAFQRFDAYRTGFLNGIATCDEIAASGG